MELTHYIDGQLVEEPKGWGEFTEDIKRNYKERMIGTEYPIDVTFTGGAYATLSDLYDSDPCGIVSYVVKQDCGNGVEEDAIVCSIVLADIEFNLDRCTATVKATDDGIGARIANNKGVKVSPGAIKSKTGEDIDAAASIDLEIFSPAAVSLGTYLPDTRRVYDWKEAMRHCVEYITDLNVTIISDWYDNLDDSERYAIVDGLELRTFVGGATNVTYTFSELFNELGKKYGLWLAATRDVDGNAVLRIEPESYFYGTASGLSLSDTRDLIRSVDQDRLFATVKVGSEQYVKDMVGDFELPYLRLRGFTEEVFSFKCGCNTDNELDLVNKWVIDTNVFEDILVNANEEYDEKMFLIQYTESTLKATQGTYLNSGVIPPLYNEELQNFKTLQRWSLFCSIGFDTGIETDTHFYAKLDAADIGLIDQVEGTDPYDVVVNQQVQFDNDYDFEPSPDPGNDYGNGTPQGSPVAQADSRYTAPSQGFYSFTAQTFFRVQISGASIVTVTLRMEVRRYSAANVLIYTSPYIEHVTAVSEYVHLLDYPSLSLDAGDYVVVYVYARSQIIPSGFGTSTVSVDMKTGGTLFKLDTSTGGGGITIPVDVDSFYGTIYGFERHCTLDQWKTLVADGSLSVSVGTRDQMFVGYPKECSRNLKTGETKWSLIANRTQR